MVTAAPARRAVDEAIHTAMLDSACPDPDLATPSRADPYWDELWAPGSTALWSTARTARRRRAHGVSRTRARAPMDEAQALRTLSGNRGRADRHATWAALQSWRTVTAEQLAALSGSRYVLDPDYSQIAASFALDVLDIGRLANHTEGVPGIGRNTLYRPSASDAFTRHLEPTLTAPEWLSVTAGQPWSFGGQYDRHNVLSTELALRAAEYLPVGAVLGETLSSVDLLAGAGLGRKLPHADNRRADGTLIRTDGLRIAFELTATVSQAFTNKVRRWAQLIDSRTLESSGLTVVFIAASHPDRSLHRNSTDTRTPIYKAVAQVLKEFPGRGVNSPAARIGVASWEEWFPDRHLVSEDFLNLRADFAVNDATGPDRWAARDLLGDYPFTPWHTFDATAVIENSRLLAASPHWLRRGDHTHLIGTPMDRAGVEIPHPAPAKPHLVTGRALGAGVGNGGDAKLPRRLRIEWD